MAVAALLFWLCTAAVGAYLLMTAAHASGNAEQPESAERVPAEEVPAEQVTVPEAPAKPVRAKDRFDPPSLRQAKSEPIPGLKALAEFVHPALAMIGFGVWLGYVISRDRTFAEIGLGVLLGTIAAGISWFLANVRAAKRLAAQPADPADADRAVAPGSAPLVASTRVLALHAVGAFGTLLFALLIAFHV